ncbi:MAG: NEW3 domain-containing protein [Actinomycetota bacterium]|nr:NEW3 domain-containing protein [Actinomycetota bacterium]
MRTIRLLAAAVILLFLGVPAAGAQEQVRLTTPYPDVAVEAGEPATFPLEVNAPAGQRVDLEITQVPEEWSATLRGGGFVIDGVFTDPEEPPQVELEVEVPAGASEGSYQVVVVATSEAGSDTLPLELRVAEAVGGNVTLMAEFPTLQGASDQTFSFSLDLANETAEEITFNLGSEGPEAWQIEVRPTAEAQAATATVPAGETGSLSVEVDPLDDAPAGTYPILVQAVGGGQTAEAELQVEITGNFAMTFTTPDERLNAQARIGSATDVPLVLINDGTAPLVGVQLSATPPSGWDVTFTPEIVEQVPPGELAEVTATISPSEEAVAGDYVVTLTAEVPEATDDVELRVTVETSPLWGFVGLALIVAALVGLGWVFRRYGRR